MACYHPRPAWQGHEGRIKFHATPDAHRELKIPCGNCIGCRLDRARQWQIRLVHESQLHRENSFLTLTYSDDHLPQYGALQYGDVQAFLKRLRKHQASQAQPRISFFCAGEYGPALGRPHYHLAVFGYRPYDGVPLSVAGNKHPLSVSKTLDKLWGKGFASVGELTPASAAYVAKYCIKKITGPASETHYTRLDPDTGEMVPIPPEFARMSLRPGIGKRWYQRFANEVHTHDGAVIDGKILPAPKYYDRLAAASAPEKLESAQYKRYVKSLDHLEDQTAERLGVRETVAKARHAQIPRKLDK